MTGRNKFYGEQLVVSMKQIELAIAINNYRRKYNMSQKEMSHMCNLYGSHHGVKFTPSDICQYEKLHRAPRKAKFQILCNVLNFNPTN